MKVEINDGNFLLAGDNYELTYDRADPLYVKLCFDGGVSMKLLIFSACDAGECIDELVGIASVGLEERADSACLVFSAGTTLWKRAEYIFECSPSRVIYGFKVFGSGSIDNIRIFEGFLKDDPRRDKYFYPYFCGPSRALSHHRSYKEFACSSEPGFTDVFSFAINSSHKTWFKYYENVRVRVNADRHYEGGDWLATPPPFLFLLSNRERSSLVSMGLVAMPGHNRFLKFQYNGGEGFGLDLNYDGFTNFDGSWASPHIIFEQNGDDVYECLDKYCAYLRSVGATPSIDRSDAPKWWFQPIFGGWGEQVFHSNRWTEFFGQKAENWDNDNVHLYCTQQAYETMLATLESKGVEPTILIVDNRWFKAEHQFDVDEELWPDMKGFIKTQHSKGRKVILWVSPWHYSRSGGGKDLPIEYQMLFDEHSSYELELDTDVFYKSCNLPMKKLRKPLELPPHTLTEPRWQFFADPQNPGYEKTLRKKIHFLLSPNGLDADGFEFDYTHFLPMHRELLHISPRKIQLYGVELLHSLMKIYYTEAKAAKPDSLIIAHTFNPYFNDVVDMLRLQDIYTDYASVVPQMSHRAFIAQRVMPGCAIHTDQHPMPSLAAWREYAQYQPKIGNPCLYYVSGIETTHEPLTDGDFKMLARVWENYRKSLSM